MTGIARRRAMLVTLAGALTVLPATLRGQSPAWRISGTVSQVWFGSTVRDTVLDDFNGRPTATAGWGLAADHSLGRVRAGIGLTYTSSYLEGYGPEVSLIDRDSRMRQVEVAALLTVPIARIGDAGAEFLLTAGPTLGFWSVTGEDDRTTFGGLAALQLAAPLGTGWRLLASAGGSLSGSPIAEESVPSDFETTTLLAGRVGVGLQYGF